MCGCFPEFEHAAKVEGESLFEAVIRGLHRLDSRFWAEEEVWDRMLTTVEVYEEPTTHTVPEASRSRDGLCSSCDPPQDYLAGNRAGQTIGDILRKRNAQVVIL